MQFSFVLAQAVIWFGNILWWCLIARAICSWFAFLRNSFIFTGLAFITEPFVSPIRKLIDKSPLGGGFLDFSVLITLLLLRLILQVLPGLILQIPI